MKTLLLMRHAKSSWKDPNLDDHDRPLNKRGKQDAPRMGELITNEDLLPDLILVSSARRAQDTARLVAKACDYRGSLETQRNFYYSDSAAYLQVLRNLPEQVERALVIGHNPILEELLHDLTGMDEHLPTAALALVELPIQSWSELGADTLGKVSGLWLPRKLRK
ncbi:MAG: histidine phosphatase family protein [Anaerolineales bacterium]|nr:histidine phosphatase family protein [Anaerolineales bacterium]